MPKCHFIRFYVGFSLLFRVFIFYYLLGLSKFHFFSLISGFRSFSGTLFCLDKPSFALEELLCLKRHAFQITRLEVTLMLMHSIFFQRLCLIFGQQWTCPFVSSVVVRIYLNQVLKYHPFIETGRIHLLKNLICNKIYFRILFCCNHT